MWVTLCLAFALFTAAAPGTLSVPQAQRIRAVEDSLLSPCCYGGPVSTHMSDIAAQMRREITDMIVEGKSDKEIREFYVAQYGPQILAEPEGTKRIVLYALPVSSTLVGGALVIAFLKRALQHNRAKQDSRCFGVGPDVAALQKVRREVSDLIPDNGN